MCSPQCGSGGTEIRFGWQPDSGLRVEVECSAQDRDQLPVSIYDKHSVRPSI